MRLLTICFLFDHCRQLLDYLKSHSPLPTTNSMLQRGGAQCLKTFHKWKLSITSGMTFLGVVTLLSRFTNSYSSKSDDTYYNIGANTPNTGNSNTSRFGNYGNKDQDANPEIFHFVASTLKVSLILQSYLNFSIIGYSI